MAAVDVGVLGPLIVRVGGEVVDLSARKQRALLAVLALEAGRVVSVDRLLNELWGEQPPATARHALQVHVSGLRKVLGRTAVLTSPPGYQLNVAPASCDAIRFQRLLTAGRTAVRDGRPAEAAAALGDALALWRGEALADLLGEPFAGREANRLEDLRLAALEERLEARLELGQAAEVLDELERLVARHPLRERLAALLMLALYRAGRQVDALRAYQALRARLRDEVGLEPGPELQRVEAAILRHDAPAAGPPAARALLIEPPGQPIPQRPALEPAVSQESRRPATVLVVGLVGLDEPARGSDPEDLRVVLDSCTGAFSSVVSRYGGTVDHVVGGDLTAVFGAPQAHEDDPERAVRTAWEIQATAREQVEDFAGLRLRVGLATGEVLFAATGSRDPRQLTVVGDVVNEARRLQAQADPGTVVIGARTLAATRRVVEVTPGPADGFTVVGVAGTTQARPLATTPFVGRDHDLELLLRAWDRTVTERRPQLVSVLGEPGVGKSRLAAEFERSIHSTARVLRGRCLAFGEALTYAPLAQAFRQAADVGTDDDGPTARVELRRLVASLDVRGEDPTELEHHLALLTGLADEGDLAAGLVDERTLHASTRRFLQALALERPVCLLLDDIHWADDALLDVAELTARRATGAPLLILTVARPELLERRERWGGGLADFTSLFLAPLDPDSTRDLVGELGRAHGLAAPLLARIAQQSGGNPLFAEELVATVAEGQAATGVPDSLTSLLLARLDALPLDQQEVLRRASVVGVTFWPAAVASLGGGPADGDLTDTLADLEHRDLLRLEDRSELAGQVTYSFKHVLVRDAAYSSLPRDRRRQLHRQAGSWLATAAGDRLADFSDQLAHHAREAGDRQRAVEHLVVAAERSRRAAAHRREAELLSEAIDLAQSLGQRDLVAELRAGRGRALSRLALWAEARAEFETALATMSSDSSDQLHRRAEVHCDLGTACFWLLDTDAIEHHARAALHLAEEVHSPELELVARAQLTNVQSARGEVDAVLADGQRLVADARTLGLEPPYERLGTYSLQLYLTADWDASIEAAEAAVRTGRRSGDTHGVLWSLPHVGLSLASSGRYDEALHAFADARRFGEEYELGAGLPRCIAMSAGFHLELQDFDGAEVIQQEAQELGRTLFKPSAVSAGIDLLFNLTRRGDVGRAELLVDDLTGEVAAGGGWHGWLWHLRLLEARAEMALARGDHQAALRLGGEARAHSRSKRRVKYEVYATLTVGRALVALGRKREALEELRTATVLASGMRSPAVQLTAAAILLDVEPDQETADRASAAMAAVLSNLSEPMLRQRFLASGPAITARRFS